MREENFLKAAVSCALISAFGLANASQVALSISGDLSPGNPFSQSGSGGNIVFNFSYDTSNANFSDGGQGYSRYFLSNSWVEVNGNKIDLLPSHYYSLVTVVDGAEDSLYFQLSGINHNLGHINFYVYVHGNAGLSLQDTGLPTPEALSNILSTSSYIEAGGENFMSPFHTINNSFNISVVPEPSGLVLAATGIFAVIGMRRRKSF